MNPLRLLLPLTALALTAGVSLAAEQKVVSHWPLGGGVLYDYLRFDGDTHRLYVARGSEFDVLNSDSGDVVTRFTGLKRTHGIALVPTAGKGYITDGDGRTVTVIDLKTLTVVKTIAVGGFKPDAIEYDETSGKVYFADGGSHEIVAIDPSTDTVAGRVLLEGKLEGIAFDGKGRLFVNTEDKSEIQVVDTAGLKALAKWPVAPGDGGTGIAIDTEHHRIFTACGNNLMVVVNSDTGAVVGTVEIGEDPDGCAFDAGRGLIYTSNLDGTLSVIRQESADHYVLDHTVKTEFGARTIALDAAGGRVFLPGGKFGPAPAPTPSVPEPKRPLIDGTFEILVVGN